MAKLSKFVAKWQEAEFKKKRPEGPAWCFRVLVIAGYECPCGDGVLGFTGVDHWLICTPLPQRLSQ
jgi:hypothetical protein